MADARSRVLPDGWPRHGAGKMTTTQGIVVAPESFVAPENGCHAATPSAPLTII